MARRAQLSQSSATQSSEASAGGTESGKLFPALLTAQSIRHSSHGPLYSHGRYAHLQVHVHGLLHHCLLIRGEWGVSTFCGAVRLFRLNGPIFIDRVMASMVSSWTALSLCLQPDAADPDLQISAKSQAQTTSCWKPGACPVQETTVPFDHQIGGITCPG